LRKDKRAEDPERKRERGPHTIVGKTQKWMEERKKKRGIIESSHSDSDPTTQKGEKGRREWSLGLEKRCRAASRGKGGGLLNLRWGGFNKVRVLGKGKRVSKK